MNRSRLLMLVLVPLLAGGCKEPRSSIETTSTDAAGMMPARDGSAGSPGNAGTGGTPGGQSQVDAPVASAGGSAGGGGAGGGQGGAGNSGAGGAGNGGAGGSTSPDAAVTCGADQKPCGGGCIAAKGCCTAGVEGCGDCRYCDQGSCLASADRTSCGNEKTCRGGACVPCRSSGSCSTNPCAESTYRCSDAVETCVETPRPNMTACGGNSQCWAGKCTEPCPTGQLMCTMDGSPTGCRRSVWTFESGTAEGVVGSVAPARVSTARARGGSSSLVTLATPQNAGGFRVALCADQQWTPTPSRSASVYLYIDSPVPLLGFSRIEFGALGRDAMSTHGVSYTTLMHPPVNQWFMMTANFKQYREGDGLVVGLSVDLNNGVDLYLDDLRLD